MTRYFPELVAAAAGEPPKRCVIDGAIVIATDHGLDFEALQQRIHPADSRVQMLAERTPASFIAFCVRAVNRPSDSVCHCAVIPGARALHVLGPIQTRLTKVLAPASPWG